MKSENNNKSKTLSELAYCQVRQDILNGILAPGEKLQISKLKDRYGIGWSPLREALNRLSTFGFVDKREQQGFYVSAIDEEGLLELTNTRIWLDELALRQSFCHEDKDWEERMLIALHRLSKCSRFADKKTSICSDDWKELHRSFHSEIISNCGSVWLINFCLQLFDQFNRYRAIVLEKTVTKRIINRREDIEHQEILNACLENNVTGAITLLASHYKLSAEIILDRKLDLLEDPFRVVYLE